MLMAELMEVIKSSSTEIAAKTDMPNQEIPTEEMRAVKQNANIPSAIHVQVDRQILCLFVLFTSHKHEYPQVVNRKFPYRSRNVPNSLRAIISPNAP